MDFLQVIYFYQDGCPACEEARPVFDELAMHYATCAMIRYVNVNNEGLYADTMQIQETPTIIGTRNQSPVVRVVGGEDVARRLNQLYSELLSGGSCPVQPWKGDI